MEWILPILFALAVAWMLFDFLTRDDRAARELDRQFRLMESRKDTRSESEPLLPGFNFHPAYEKWEKEAAKLGFTKLGDFQTEHAPGGPIGKVVTRVMTDAERTTILAFSRMIVGGRIIEQTEMENWRADGTFLYSTNNHLVYHLKSPEGIRLNKVTEYSLPRFVASHEKFMQETGAGPLKAYRDIETVLQTIAIQQSMRREFSKTKEFPIDEEEANRITGMAKGGRYRKIYGKLRELRELRKLRDTAGRGAG